MYSSKFVWNLHSVTQCVSTSQRCANLICIMNIWIFINYVLQSCTFLAQNQFLCGRYCFLCSFWLEYVCIQNWSGGFVILQIKAFSPTPHHVLQTQTHSIAYIHTATAGSATMLSTDIGIVFDTIMVCILICFVYDCRV